MKVSKELLEQMQRLSNMGSFRVTEEQKKELSSLTEEIGVTKLVNFGCGTCVRKAMYDVHSYLKRSEERPVLSMKMVKDPEEMTFQELRKACKDKGIKFKSTDKKETLIKKLK